MQAYSNPEREKDTWSLSDVEVFYADYGDLWENEDELFQNGYEEPNEPGYYYWFCLPGCMPDSDPIGPFETEEDAVIDSQSNSEA